MKTFKIIYADKVTREIQADSIDYAEDGKLITLRNEAGDLVAVVVAANVAAVILS